MPRNVIQTGAQVSKGTLMKKNAVSRFWFVVSRTVLAGLLLTAMCAAQPQQLPQSSQPMSAAPAPAPPMPSDLGSAVSSIDQAAQATAASLKSVRVDKWKTDSGTKQQAQQNIDSLSRNLTAALPGMIQQVRANPGSVAAQFKLYRNVNALLDVLSTMTEAAGTFGAKNDYQTLSSELNTFDQARIALANRLENATAQQDAEVARLRASVQQAQAAARAAATPPKKVVIDDNEPPTPKKKSSSKSGAKKKSSTTGGTAPSSSKPANPPQ
jgi:hypothetical protein